MFRSYPDFRDIRDPRGAEAHRPRSPISARSPIRASTPNDEMAAKRLKTDDIRKSGHVSDIFYSFISLDWMSTKIFSDKYVQFQMYMLFKESNTTILDGEWLLGWKNERCRGEAELKVKNAHL